MKYIKKTNQRQLRERREFLLYGDINIFVKDALPSEVNVTNVVQDIEDTIPRHLLHEVETILIGQFKELVDRGIRAAYMDGGIYVTNSQPNDEQLYEDIVHEIAHAVEKTFETEIYSDGYIENEYLGKKKRFLDTMAASGIKVPNRLRVGTEYSKVFDEFLHFQLGYEKTTNFSLGLFLSPYSSVSVSEYFATAFEYYYISDDEQYLRTLCPAVYAKLETISNGEQIT